MVRIILILLSLSFLVLSWDSAVVASVFNDLRGIDKETYQSYDQFWKAYQTNKKQKTRKERDQLYLKIRSYEEDFEKQEREDLKKQFSLLNKAIEKYEDQFEKAESKQDRANLLFNIAKSNYLQAQILTKLKQAGADSKLKTAESRLRQLREHFPGYSNYSEGLYTLGLVLEEIGKDDEALQVWKQLASDTRVGLFTVKGQMRAGDLLFIRDIPGEAKDFYLSAKKTLQSLGLPGQEQELLKIEYRLAWAAYRHGDLSQLLRGSEELLTAGRYAGPTMQAMRQDAFELLADAIVERGSKEMAVEWMQRPAIVGQAPTVALLIMERYVNTGQYENAVYLGRWAASRFGLSPEYPKLLVKEAQAYKELGRTLDFIKSLENLSMLLPRESLWRSRNASNQSLVSQMEEDALKATKAVAAYYYERGMETSNRQHYQVAASYYNNLVAYYGQSTDSVIWRLREANCRYFSSQYVQAAELYLQLQSKFNLTAEQLELAMYQRVVSHEAIWRQDFTGETDISSEKQKNIAERLQFLNASVDDYLTKFPKSTHGMDLSLLVANANRDFSRHDVAQRYLKRVMNGKAKSNQVAAAVRGLTYSALQKGDRKELIDLLIDVLRVKDKVALNQAVISEVLSVLSVSLSEQGKHLSEAGKLAEAGLLMKSVSEQFKTLPDRDKLVRDAAIFLAMAGYWQEVQALSSSFEEEFPKSPHRFDMLYLKARAYQFQLKFPEAIQAYLHYGALAAGHSKRVEGLQKASQLAEAQGDKVSYARAAEILAAANVPKDDKFQHQADAVERYLQADLIQDALTAAEKMRGMASDQSQRLQANLTVAKVRLKTGDKAQALRSIQSLEKEAAGLAARGGGSRAEQTAAEANYLLANYHLTNNTTHDETLESRLKRFNQAAPHFEKAYRRSNTEWAVRSRYEQSLAGIQLADDVYSFANRGPRISAEQADRYTAIAEKLREEARRNLNTNIALRASDPVFAGQDPWIIKSQSLLNRVESSTPKSRPLDAVMNYDMPRQWSH